MLEIIAKVKMLGAIDEKRNQTIELSNVEIFAGDFCIEKKRHIIFLDKKESEKFIQFYRSTDGRYWLARSQDKEYKI